MIYRIWIKKTSQKTKESGEVPSLRYKTSCWIIVNMEKSNNLQVFKQQNILWKERKNTNDESEILLLLWDNSLYFMPIRQIKFVIVRTGPIFVPRAVLFERSNFPISKKRPCCASTRKLACSFSSASEFNTMSTPGVHKHKTSIHFPPDSSYCKTFRIENKKILYCIKI